MKRPVVLTAEAEGDLQSILTFIGEDSIAQAIATVDRLERASSALGEAALRYPLVTNHEHSQVRRRVVGSYSIFYRVRADLVEVLHVLHSARDYERILFPDEP
jgi:toxin ParE1/3/4